MEHPKKGTLTMSAKICGAHFKPGEIYVSWFAKNNRDYRSAKINRGTKAELNLIRYLNKFPFTVSINAVGFSIHPRVVQSNSQIVNRKLAEKLERKETNL